MGPGNATPGYQSHSFAGSSYPIGYFWWTAPRASDGSWSTPITHSHSRLPPADSSAQGLSENICLFGSLKSKSGLQGTRIAFSSITLTAQSMMIPVDGHWQAFHSICTLWGVASLAWAGRGLGDPAPSRIPSSVCQNGFSSDIWGPCAGVYGIYRIRQEMPGAFT